MVSFVSTLCIAAIFTSVSGCDHHGKTICVYEFEGILKFHGIKYQETFDYRIQNGQHVWIKLHDKWRKCSWIPSDQTDGSWSDGPWQFNCGSDSQKHKTDPIQQDDLTALITDGKIGIDSENGRELMNKYISFSVKKAPSVVKKESTLYHAVGSSIGFRRIGYDTYEITGFDPETAGQTELQWRVGGFIYIHVSYTEYKPKNELGIIPNQPNEKPHYLWMKYKFEGLDRRHNVDWVNFQLWGGQMEVGTNKYGGDHDFGEIRWNYADFIGHCKDGDIGLNMDASKKEPTKFLKPLESDSDKGTNSIASKKVKVMDASKREAIGKSAKYENYDAYYNYDEYDYDEYYDDEYFDDDEMEDDYYNFGNYFQDLYNRYWAKRPWR